MVAYLIKQGGVNMRRFSLLLITAIFAVSFSFAVTTDERAGMYLDTLTAKHLNLEQRQGSQECSVLLELLGADKVTEYIARRIKWACLPDSLGSNILPRGEGLHPE